MIPTDQEMCPVCNYCKLINKICTKCKRYINEDYTPTTICTFCSNRKLVDDICFHDHTLKQFSLPNTFSVAPKLESSFIFLGNDNKTEILKISPEGFWVRGEKIPQDENEAKTVYQAVKELLGYK